MSAELATTPRVQQIDALFRVRLGPLTAAKPLSSHVTVRRAYRHLSPIISGSVR